MTSLADKIQRRRQQAGVAPAASTDTKKKQTHSLPLAERIAGIVETVKLVHYDQFAIAEELGSLLSDGKISQIELAKKIGKTQSWISKKVALLSAPDDIQKKIRTGELATTKYYEETAERGKKITITRKQAVEIAKLFRDISIKYGLAIDLSKKPTKAEILAAFSRVKDIKGAILNI